MSMDEATKIITTVGFPIAAWILIYCDLRKKVEELSGVIRDLKESIIDLKT